MKLRGPGDFFGIRQSGDLVFALADIYQDAAVLQEASEEVKTILEEDYMETCEDIRHTEGMKELYSNRKETIERIFGTAKENHGFRYTQLYGKARMTMKVALTFACMNLKKLAKCKQEWGLRMA